jgi:hypothetical protein
VVASTPTSTATIGNPTTTLSPPRLVSLVVPPFRGRSGQSWLLPVVAAVDLVFILGGLARFTGRGTSGKRRRAQGAGTGA